MIKMSLQAFFYLLIFVFIVGVQSFPEKGRWVYDIDETNEFVGVSKSMFAGTKISVYVLNCKADDSSATLTLSWSLRHSPCWQEYIGLETTGSSGGSLYTYFSSPHTIREGLNYTAVEYLQSEESTHQCDRSKITLPEVNKPMEKKRLVRQSTSEHPQYVVSKDGIYLFILKTKATFTKPPISGVNHSLKAQVVIEMKSEYGYLSVVDWPLLPFYATMCGIYTFLGLLWLIICLCRWRDILRIQIWIGGVLFLGMLEMAVYLAEYESLNKTGELTLAAEYSAELLSCAKRTLARILVLIASMGFGIVKPRLGVMLQRIVGVGVIYMIVSSAETYMKLVQPKNNTSRNTYAASLLLALMDAALSFWIFSSLVQTTRTLRLRRNAVKLSLYQHFTNTLVFAVVASLIFMLWSIYYHQMVTCLTDWKELWLDEAFWKLLFSLLLLVIMLLWRPTNNNQRYAFTPLLDSGDETEEDDIVVHDNLMGMKMRTNRTNHGSAPSPRSTSQSNSIEDDLKWVEENIPSSMVEAGMPLLDSEEEIMTTRFELSKMQ